VPGASAMSATAGNFNPSAGVFKPAAAATTNYNGFQPTQAAPPQQNYGGQMPNNTYVP